MAVPSKASIAETALGRRVTSRSNFIFFISSLFIIVVLVCTIILRSSTSDGKISDDSSAVTVASSPHKVEVNSKTIDEIKNSGDGATSIQTNEDGAMPPLAQAVDSDHGRSPPDLPLIRDPAEVEQCNVMDAQTTKGKPIWMPGYPGSGFLILEKIIPMITGVDATTVYFKHTCVDDDSQTSLNSAVCVTHWPFIHRDAPLEVEGRYDAKVKDKYFNSSCFIIRNPAHAIPSFFTRRYGSQLRIHRSHEQPPESAWIRWRDQRLAQHISAWKETVIRWHDSIEGTSIVEGVGFYVPYEFLIHQEKGPQLIQKLTEFFQYAHHPTILDKTERFVRKGRRLALFKSTKKNTNDVSTNAVVASDKDEVEGNMQNETSIMEMKAANTYKTLSVDDPDTENDLMVEEGFDSVSESVAGDALNEGQEDEEAFSDDETIDDVDSKKPEYGISNEENEYEAYDKKDKIKDVEDSIELPTNKGKSLPKKTAVKLDPTLQKSIFTNVETVNPVHDDDAIDRNEQDEEAKESIIPVKNANAVLNEEEEMRTDNEGDDDAVKPKELEIVPISVDTDEELAKDSKYNGNEVLEKKALEKEILNATKNATKKTTKKVTKKAAKKATNAAMKKKNASTLMKDLDPDSSEPGQTVDTIDEGDKDEDTITVANDLTSNASSFSDETVDTQGADTIASSFNDETLGTQYAGTTITAKSKSIVAAKSEKEDDEEGRTYEEEALEKAILNATKNAIKKTTKKVTKEATKKATNAAMKKKKASTVMEDLDPDSSEPGQNVDTIEEGDKDEDTITVVNDLTSNASSFSDETVDTKGADTNASSFNDETLGTQYADTTITSKSKSIVAAKSEKKDDEEGRTYDEEGEATEDPEGNETLEDGETDVDTETDDDLPGDDESKEENADDSIPDEKIDGDSSEKNNFEDNSNAAVTEESGKYLESESTPLTKKADEADPLEVNPDLLCIWNEVVKPDIHVKAYDYKFTLEQKQLFLDAIDELLKRFHGTSHDSMITRAPIDELITLLEMYRESVDTTLEIGT